MNTPTVQDIYPLSPMQQGMLFHSLYAPESGMYTEQLACTLHGDLDVSAFESAWQRALDHHPVLRTAFVWEGVDEPLQVVVPQAKLPFQTHDWRELSEAEQATQIETFLQADRARGFELSEAPLMRLNLLRTNADAWRFIWTHHHVLLDGWSVPLLLTQVMKIYEASRRGIDAAPEPSRPYRDYIAWLQKQDRTKAEAFWRETLKGLTAPTPLVVDRGNAKATEPYTIHRAHLPANATAALLALARQEQLTLNTLIQGAWALLLSRYSGEERVVFGATVSGRPADLPGAESMVGLFINTLPVCARVPPDAPLVPWLKTLQAQQVELRQYEYNSLAEIQGWSNVPRGQPLFESILVFENYPVDASIQEQGSIKISSVRSFSRTNYPLTIAVTPGREIRFEIAYDSRRFDADTIARMFGHLQTLLASFATKPAHQLSTLPLLTDSERHQLLVEWNDTTTDGPHDPCVHQLIEQQVEQTPDAPAVTCGEQSLTYRELNARANQLARHLRALGVGPDVLVGILIERSLEMVVGVLGVLKAGGAYVPLDPTYPQARLEFMLRDAAVSVLVTQARLVESLPRLAAHTICLDRDWSVIAQQSDENLANTSTANDLAYVIYTSGSTGQPKGVMIPHRALVNHAAAMKRVYALTPDDRVLQFISLSFDASAEELFPSLIGGARLVLWTGGAELNQLTAFCERELITILHLPAVFWHQWMDALKDSAFRASVRLLLVGGEAPSPEKLQQWARVVGGSCQFINAYGPTEATITTTLYQTPCDAETIVHTSKIPIGRPIANARAYVLDGLLQPVPINVPGELYIGGAGLARGYLNRPELTTERFIRDQFSDDAGARLYKTGDLVRYLPDGNIEFIGRTDDQVKLRGFRIELGEIEAALTRHPAVRETAVVARQDSPADALLVAYVAPAADSKLQPADLRALLQDRLPSYMIPSAFVVLDALPRLPNGKVDRRALPAPESARPELANAYVAPRTPTEEILAGIWAQVLGIERIGIHDNFFDLGGHSLLATQVISRAREAFGIELPLRSLFESPTVAALAEQVESIRQAGAGAAAPPIRPASREGDLPLSFAQQRLWFLDQLEPGSAFYNNPMAIKLRGKLDVTALQRALNGIVLRHESLRTTFAAVGGKPAQRIAPASTCTLPVADLRDLPESTRAAEALRLATVEARQPFDLAQGPLLRARLLQLGDEDHIALLTLHHIISDGWSMGVLIHEIAALYQAFIEGKPAPLDALPIQYADFARWQREWLQGETLDAQIAYWKQQLNNIPPMLDLPTDRPRPAMQTFTGAHHSFTLPKPLAQSLEALSRREGVTLFMTLLAAFQTLLYRYTGQDDICIGTPIANRHRAEIENLIGFFVNTLVLRGDLSGEPSFGEFLARVRETALGAYAHQDLPFEMLVETLQPKRDLSHTPLFQAMFVLDNAPMRPLDLPGLTMRALDTESGTARFDITLSVSEWSDGLSGMIEYNTDLFDADRIARMAGHFQTLLESIVAGPERSITTLPLLTGAERQQMLIEWNDTTADFPRDACIHELFEQQVVERPTAMAALFEDRQLTYAELNARANQLAHYLQKLGIKPETLVGICAERSLEMIVGILGTLKAGGAYLPLDPNYPPERLAFMLQDSQSPVLLTQSPLAELVDALRAESCRVVYLDADCDVIAQESADNAPSGATAENLAYVIYTSGSTGKPKGTLLQHRGLCNLATWQRRVFGIAEGKRVLQFSPFSFDACVWETFMALRNGGALVLARQETLASAPDLVQLMQEKEITTATLPPSLLATMPVEDASIGSEHTLPKLEMLIAAGEACPRELVARWASERRFFNAYGPTETTVCASMARCDENDPRAPSIGKPIANTQLYILDAHLQVVPIGVSGELCVGGVSLARGYLNRPELTTVKFVRDPFSDEPNARLYKTGDLVRYRPNGDIEFLGRIDQQVKVRGFRIELGEIEAALEQHPNVRQAVATARDDEHGDKRLVAYLVAGQEPAPSVGDLRGFLKTRLPEYMTPSAFVILPSLPMTPNGKVDRRALPAPEGTRPELGHAYIAPRTPMEETLAKICAELLEIEQVGVEDDFFELGGHSLLATQFVSRVREACQVELPLRSLFETPTIAGLAQTIEQAQMRGEQTPLPRITPAARSAHRVKLSSLSNGGNGSSQTENEVMRIAQ